MSVSFAATLFRRMRASERTSAERIRTALAANRKKGKEPGRSTRHEGTKLGDREGAPNAVCRNPRNCTFSMGGTLRGRFELPRALRPTRSQVWRVGPSFATSALRHRPRSEIPSLTNSLRGTQRLDIELERHHGLDQRIGLEDSRMDLPESTDLATVQHDRGRAPGDEIPVLDGIDLRGPTDVPHQAED